MTDNNENPFDSMDEEFPFEDFESETTVSSSSNPGSSPRSRPRSGNRNFWLAVGILAAVFVVVVIILTVIAFIIVPQNQQARLEEAALINAHNTATSVAATDFAILQAQKAIPTETLLPTETMVPSATPVVVLATETQAPSPTEDRDVGGPADDPARTATVAALLTQAAGGGTPLATTQGGGLTPTALPQSGFVEDVGLPGLFGLAIALIVLIVLVRRLRLSNSG